MDSARFLKLFGRMNPLWNLKIDKKLTDGQAESVRFCFDFQKIVAHFFCPRLFLLIRDFVCFQWTVSICSSATTVTSVRATWRSLGGVDGSRREGLLTGNGLDLVSSCEHQTGDSILFGFILWVPVTPAEYSRLDPESFGAWFLVFCNHWCYSYSCFTRSHSMCSAVKPIKISIKTVIVIGLIAHTSTCKANIYKQHVRITFPFCKT